MERITVSILTIGTEVVEGEIVNSNAATLASLLVDYGYTILRHLTVADDRETILTSMNDCAKDSNLLVITGGLGPTKDDFTRDVIATWCDLPMAFDDASWSKIVERLNSLGVPVAESNRQQCYFPKGSQILLNPAGTAQGFRIEHRPKDSRPIEIVALPGPPHEIQAILNAGLSRILEDSKPKQKPNRLHIWRCMGVSESQLGEIVEDALKGSGFITGYRPHIPYVDVKVWTPSTIDSKHPVFEKLEQSIATWLISRGQEDFVLEGFIKLLRSFNACTIVDNVTGGKISERLSHFVHKDISQRIPKSALTLVTNINPPLSAAANYSPEINHTLLEVNQTPHGFSFTLKTPNMTRALQKNIAFGRPINATTQGRFRAFVTESIFLELNKIKWQD